MDKKTAGSTGPDRKKRELTRHPEWLRVKLPSGEGYNRLKRLVAKENLHTVCESASCPNIGECWARGALTFMILGDVCTRACRFCDVESGVPRAADPAEPERVARSVKGLGLRHAVITSVDRDDLPDEGAGIWAETIRRVREAAPEMTVEALTPDFHARPELIETVCAAGPHIYAHNIETVERLQGPVRLKSDWKTSLETLRIAKRAGMTTKSGMMLGMGETRDEIIAAMQALRDAGCDILTLGQYLRPNLKLWPVEKHYSPEEFQSLEAEAKELGFASVTAGPLVRSSYYADKTAPLNFG